MKNFYLVILCIFSCSVKGDAQTRYLVKFKNKGASPYSFSNPSQYLGPRALDRRLRYGIAIDSADLPVTPSYVDAVRLSGAVTILNTSKWLNEVAIRTTDPAALANIANLPFVMSVSVAAAFSSGQTPPVIKTPDYVSPDPIPDASSFIGGTTADVFNYGRAHGQIHLHQGEFLHNHGFKGEGMQISVLDGGFFHYLSLPTFDSIRNNNQILNTWDFVDNQASVDEDNNHGMNCLSTMAANIPGVFVGTAPKANYTLFRTEDVNSEYKIEEHNLAAGFERADSIGADVCSVSLGYFQFDNAAQNYVYANMNGDFTLSAIASDIAAAKGMLPVIAAGNEGTHAWHYISTPGDADSVMTVGAVDTLGNIASFSGYGPASDGRVKPNIAATGLNAVIANNSTGQPTYGNGTSFATPVIAGLTTCLWQAFPEYNNMTILDAMQRAGTKYTSPNDRIGYGIPDIKKAFVILLRKSYTQQASVTNCTASFQLTVKEDNSMNVVIERKQSAELVYSPVRTIAGAGSFTNKNLNFTEDLSTLQSGGTVSYRVRLDIAADTTVYLDSLTLNVPETCVHPVNAIDIKPNPVNDVANIVISRAAASSVAIMMTNAAGQRVYETSYTQAPGTQIRTIDMSRMSAGVYYVSILAEGKIVSTKRILKR